jgi:hypothetical protein
MGLGPVHHHLGGPGPAVVVGAHAEPVGTAPADGQQIPRGQGQEAVLTEEVRRLAHRPDEIVAGGLGLAVQAHRDDLLLRLVEGRAHQVVHGRIQDREPTVGGRLQILDPGQEHTGVAHDRPPRLQDHLVGTSPQPVQQGARIGGGLRRDLGRIADPEPAPQIQVRDGDAR